MFACLFVYFQDEDVDVDKLDTIDTTHDLHSVTLREASGKLNKSSESGSRFNEEEGRLEDLIQ